MVFIIRISQPNVWKIRRCLIWPGPTQWKWPQAQQLGPQAQFVEIPCSLFSPRQNKRSLSFSKKTISMVQARQFASVVQADENDKNQVQVQEAEPSLRHRFVPMTRRTLVRKLIEDGNLIGINEQLIFHDFCAGLDTTISRGFHGVLGELKALYDPLNPDKETMVVGRVGRNERLDNEFWLLQKLSKLLEKAHFQELSTERVEAALREHPVFEGVLVSVDTKKYDVLRFWALGQDEGPIEASNLRDKIVYAMNVLLRKAPRKVPRYKRVVVMVRTKKQNKLMLKAFKDIPTNSLEYLLPEGKIKMSKSDRGIIATTVFIGLTSGLVKLISSLADYHVQWTYIAGTVTALLALRAWNAYKNKRNAYLVNLSSLLYFKTVANNRALLTLIVDRAEDETFKSALMAYTFLRSSVRLVSGGEDPSEMAYVDGMTAAELQEQVENWMKTKYDLDVKYDTKDALKQLDTLGILIREQRGEGEILRVLSFETALEKVPVPTTPRLLEREEDLDVEQLIPENDQEWADQMDKSDEEKGQTAARWR